jgi:dihydrofolate synthase/folylpolyglutamate synthase
VIVADPKPPQSVLNHAAGIKADLWHFGVDFHLSSSQSQWDWEGRGLRHSALAWPALRGAHQLVNAAGVLAALGALRERLPVTDQAVRQGLASVALPGRFQIVPGQPTLVLDMAHNPHSVAALATNLEAMGHFATTHAVFGAMADKDLGPMLASIDPLIDKWYFTDLPTPRAASGAELLHRWEIQNTRPDANASFYPAPEQALQAALKAAVPTDRIVVFGSFYTVGSVLQDASEWSRE